MASIDLFEDFRTGSGCVDQIRIHKKTDPSGFDKNTRIRTRTFGQSAKGPVFR